MTPINESQRECFYIYNKQKIRTVYIYTQKARHFSKNKTIFITFLYTKSHTLYFTRFLYFLLELIYVQNHDTLCYVTFLYKTPETSKQAIQFAFCFLYTKSLTLFVTQVFMQFLKFEEGGAFYALKTMNFALHF